MWAAGIILFQLIYNKHPLDLKGSCTKLQMEEKLKNYTEISFPNDSSDIKVSH